MDNKIIPESLNPQEKMRVNAPCWCNSGKKWKKCHKDRHLKKEVIFGELFSKIKNESRTGYCLHPQASSNECNHTINAHTIQRKGGLSEITENGHVISPKRGAEDIDKNHGKTTPQKFGIKKASTFKGFCGFHDNEMFNLIEQKEIILCKETAFLLSFRAISYEYLAKESAVRATEFQRELDNGKPFETQVMVQNITNIRIQGLKIGMTYVEKTKSAYNAIYLSKNYNKFQFYAIQFSGLLPVVASGAFNPQYDFNGNELQQLTDLVDSLDSITVNITSFKGKSILVLGWLPSTKNISFNFAKSFMNLKPSEKSNMAIYLALEEIENIYFKPSWWNSLPTNKQTEIEKRQDSGILGNKHKGIFTNIPFALSNLSAESEIMSRD